MNEHKTPDVAALLEVGAAQSIARFVGADGEIGKGHPYVVVPGNHSVHSLEGYLPRPTRHTGSRLFFDADSFISYVNQLKNTSNGTTRLYGRVRPSPAFEAVFNDSDWLAAWGDFRATYDAPVSVEWGIWTGSDGKGMNQETFANFVEKNLPDVVEPTAADFLEISRTLEAKKAVNFKSAIRLSDGKNQFTYEEDIKGTASNGRLEIPETFKIGIPVLEGGPRYAVEARLRYRIKEGQLVLWYELVRPHKIMEDAANELKAYIAEKTNLEVLNGKA